jgi:tRNA/tmRNA/rRNA uracil-C5-methylase (TrmA/RlmC/RlmD family)
MREEVDGTSFLLSPTAFFQTNVLRPNCWCASCSRQFPEGAKVLDLYAGAGLFALPLARRGHRVVAVEENRAAMILDPPREGCAPVVIDAVFGRIRPERAIYVSCNPEALAHDLRLIPRHSYILRSLQPVDVFPHTAHVETVAVLDQRPSDRRPNPVITSAV